MSAAQKQIAYIMYAAHVPDFCKGIHQHNIYIHTCIYMIALIIMPFIDRINIRYKLLGTYI